MTFSNVRNRTATSSGLARLRDGSGTVFATNAKVLWSTDEDLHGSGICSISSGVITLPVGYYYLVEASMSCASSVVDEISLQLYDENTSSYVGTESYLNCQDAANSEHARLFAKDDMSRLWVDAKSSAGSVSFRMKAPSSFYQCDVQYYGLRRRVGYSRCLVWRFD